MSRISPFSPVSQRGIAQYRQGKEKDTTASVTAVGSAEGLGCRSQERHALKN